MEGMGAFVNPKAFQLRGKMTTIQEVSPELHCHGLLVKVGLRYE